MRVPGAVRGAILPLVLAGLALAAPRASALVLPPVTLAGPDTSVLEMGGAALGPDGTGGVVFIKASEGAPHVFASRYDGNGWSEPIRVDNELPYDGGQPAIAAGPNGRLMVVWVSQVATVRGHIRRGLYSATLGPGAISFGPPLLVDANVGDGTGVDPSLAGFKAGQAIVAYRVVTETFSERKEGAAVQLRPGDVLADIRVARFAGDHWSKVGAINRNPAISMRPPTAMNGPKVAVDPVGEAVVAWQEPDQTGVARIWARRIFGTTPGPVLPISPSTWNGAAVTGDAESFSLAMTELGETRVAMDIASAGGSPLGGSPRVLVNTLPSKYAKTGGAPSGAVLADNGGNGGLAGGAGAPSIAVADSPSGGPGKALLAFTAGGGVSTMEMASNGQAAALALPGSQPSASGEPLSALGPDGSGVLAWPAPGVEGQPSVAVRQFFSSGGGQLGTVAGPIVGPVSQLAIGSAPTGDALIAFRQGEPGRYAIVADRISDAPAEFGVEAPSGWVTPAKAKLRWELPASAVGGLEYTVLVDRRAVGVGLGERALKLAGKAVGSGVHEVQVLATDRLGESTLSRPTKLRIDSEPPKIAIAVRRGSGKVSVRIEDPDSGVRVAATACNFGGGVVLRRRKRCDHTYKSPGTYPVTVRARDRVGNDALRRVKVKVR